MRSVLVAAAAALALFAVAHACDEEVQCEYTLMYGGSYHYWNFRGLCKTDGDYVHDDGDGHEYHAQICGTATAQCLPSGWDNTLQFGVAVQYWGGLPDCNNPATKCVDKVSGHAKCCTKNCEVLGTGLPHFSLEDYSHPSMGIHITYQGALPDDDDPYWCPWNPETGEQYPRTVRYEMACDPDTKGLATVVDAVQNETEKCDYHITFASSDACPASHPVPWKAPGGSSGLSGGWIFIIILICLAVVYFGGGFLYTYHTERVWAPPNRQFWSSFGQYTSDGVSFIIGGCKLSKTTAGAGASPYDEIGGASGGGGNTFGGSSYNAAAEPPSTAYTDL